MIIHKGWSGAGRGLFTWPMLCGGQTIESIAYYRISDIYRDCVI